jgi:hypothetical protein
MKTKQELINHLRLIIQNLKEKRNKYEECSAFVGLNSYSGMALDVTKEIRELEHLLNDLEAF